jgi:toxin ParE1/3/4
MRLELSRRAQADLDDIADYSVAHFGAARAILYVDAIEAAFRRLLSHPEIGAPAPDMMPNLRSVPVGEHRVFYLVDVETVLIVRVLHQSMDVRRHL